MKIAISVPDEVFEAGEHLARQLGISRSQLYSDALASYLSARNSRISSMKRGEVWWASLPAPTGSGRGFRRPVLVIQSDPFNHSRIATIVAAVITSNLALADSPGNVRMGKSESGLAKPSVVNVSQVVTLDRQLLTQRVRAVPGTTMRHVDEGLRLVLGL
jgi:mRNA interferase MazF